MKKGRTHTTVTIRGDGDYVRALKALAAIRNTKIGDLVRDAIDESYGIDIENFFTETARQHVQQESEGAELQPA